MNVDGLRGDIVVNRAAKALVAFEGRTEVKEADIERVISLCLNHRYQQGGGRGGRGQVAKRVTGCHCVEGDWGMFGRVPVSVPVPDAFFVAGPIVLSF